MDTQQYTYYAFISYQRKDEKWAKWLQRKLENYKLPVVNAKDASDKKSKYIRPVFRDKTDLTAGPLPDALKEALFRLLSMVSHILMTSPKNASRIH